MDAYNAGYQAAKSGCNINNCYPYVKGNGYWEWLDGYRAYPKDI
jgi:ribosome modulation factor